MNGDREGVFDGYYPPPDEKRTPSESRETDEVQLYREQLQGALVAIAQIREHLRQQAELYQKQDGSPGPLGENCWGWRDIARILREAAGDAAVSSARTLSKSAETVETPKQLDYLKAHILDEVALERDALAAQVATLLAENKELRSASEATALLERVHDDLVLRSKVLGEDAVELSSGLWRDLCDFLGKNRADSRGDR